ncbi:hypothetical protein O4H66_11375 [Comamonadaceae bacterium G21597-S1]|nr:hypothetical protein [Comamonadaceae bacterium G21597-S1]
MLLVVTALKLITETALMVLLGQWLLGVLAGARRDGNLAYQLLQMAGRPFVAVARRLSPRWVVDRHLPLVAALMLAFAWLALTFFKINLCLQVGIASCR